MKFFSFQEDMFWDCQILWKKNKKVISEAITQLLQTTAEFPQGSLL